MACTPQLCSQQKLGGCAHCFNFPGCSLSLLTLLLLLRLLGRVRQLRQCCSSQRESHLIWFPFVFLRARNECCSQISLCGCQACSYTLDGSHCIFFFLNSCLRRSRQTVIIHWVIPQMPTVAVLCPPHSGQGWKLTVGNPSPDLTAGGQKPNHLGPCGWFCWLYQLEAGVRNQSQASNPGTRGRLQPASASCQLHACPKKGILHHDSIHNINTKQNVCEMTYVLTLCDKI